MQEPERRAVAGRIRPNYTRRPLTVPIVASARAFLPGARWEGGVREGLPMPREPALLTSAGPEAEAAGSIE